MALFDTSTGGEGSFAQLWDNTLGSDTASFDIVSITSSYISLHLMLYIRSDRAATVDNIGMRFNGDSAGNYYSQSLESVSTAVGAAAANAGNQAAVADASGNTALANAFTPVFVEIYNYAGTTGLKTWLSNGGYRQAAGSNGLTTFNRMGEWESTAAINRITVLPVLGSNFKTGSRATLWGKK